MAFLARGIRRTFSIAPISRTFVNARYLSIGPVSRSLPVYGTSFDPNAPTNPSNKVIVDAFDDAIQERVDKYGIETQMVGTTSYYRVKALEDAREIILDWPDKITDGESMRDVYGIGQSSIDIIDSTRWQ